MKSSTIAPSLRSTWRWLARLHDPQSNGGAGVTLVGDASVTNVTARAD